MPERKMGEAYNQQQEWDRDGQYFHYLTRWFNALLLAFEETGETKFAIWANELIKAGEKFLIKKKDSIGMAWKMNIVLSQPLVESMGAHDPLEALICIYRAGNAVKYPPVDLDRMQNAVEALCRDMNWFTYDPLGIGGLLLSTKRSCELILKGESLPAAIRPEYLFAGARAGLKTFTEQVYAPGQTDKYRLAFRECGLALGVYALYGMKVTYQDLDVNVNELERHIPLVQEIISFWSEPSNRSSSGWHAHEDINEIMLAAGLLSAIYPQSY